MGNVLYTVVRQGSFINTCTHERMKGRGRRRLKSYKKSVVDKLVFYLIQWFNFLDPAARRDGVSQTEGPGFDPRWRQTKFGAHTPPPLLQVANNKSQGSPPSLKGPWVGWCTQQAEHLERQKNPWLVSPHFYMCPIDSGETKRKRILNDWRRKPKVQRFLNLHDAATRNKNGIRSLICGVWNI